MEKILKQRCAQNRYKHFKLKKKKKNIIDKNNNIHIKSDNRVFSLHKWVKLQNLSKNEFIKTREI